MTDIEGVQCTLNYILFNAEINTSEIALLFITAALLLFLSALISGSEVAFFSLQANDIEEILDKGTFRAQTVAKLKNDPKRLLSTLLIANNTINVGIIIISSYLLARLFQFENETIQFLIEVVLITSILMLLGEIVPKVYATQNNKALSYFMAKPLYYLGNIPPVSWMNKILISSTNIIEKRIARNQEELSAEEFNQAIDLTIKDDEDLADERKILKGLMKFGNISVKQIMRNRMDVIGLDSHSQFTTVLETIKSSGYSRIPVFSETFDNIKGILYSKDLLEHHHQIDFKWADLLRPAFFVPENKKISNLLKEFQSKKIHLALVVDEYGGTSGIITLEDILEEIVGDIKDEYDFDDLNYLKISDLEYIVDGKTFLVDALRLLKIPENYFEDAEEEVDSIAGLILEQTGSIPKFKEQIRFKDLLFTIESVGKKSINRVRISIENEKIVETKV